MRNRPQIILIDDDEIFCANLKTFFLGKDLPVAIITDPNVALTTDFRQYKVVLLDIDMPEVSGRHILAALPMIHRPIVIMVSGHSDPATRLACLDEGADFFIPKPVDLAEICAISMRALGRADRVNRSEGEWILSRTKLSITGPDGRTFGLSSSEYRILEKLFRSTPDPASREELVLAATGRIDASALAFGRSLEVMISRLRARVSSEEAKLPIKSLRNTGYIFHGVASIVE